MFSKQTEVVSRPSLRFPALANQIVKLQQKQQVGVILVTVLISGLAVYGAASLETDFDLADFVDEDMEVMEVRDALTTGYESAGWKVVHLLMEPADGQTVIPGDADLLTEMRNFHTDLKRNNDVVGTSLHRAPSYEGPYPLLRDALLRNQTLGEEHNLEI